MGTRYARGFKLLFGEFWNMKTLNDYALMQKEFYEKEAGNMNATGNHRHHDVNPDYKNILLGRLSATPEIFKNEIALDFGCGQGRNVSNIISWFPNLFSRVEGVDISSNNIKYCEINLAKEIGDTTKYKFHVNDGKSLENLKSDSYKFVMSTIVFQHICVHETRFSLMSEIFRLLKSNGIFSFQMGFGPGHSRAASYYENMCAADTTNSGYDVQIVDPQNLVDDLVKIGFEGIKYVISKSDYDSHRQWIFVEAEKP